METKLDFPQDGGSQLKVLSIAYNIQRFDKWTMNEDNQQS